MSLVGSVVATQVHFGVAENPAMDERTAWTIVGGLGGAWISCFVMFMLLIKRRYWATFYSFETGYQFVQSTFSRDGDEKKKTIMRYNKKLWLGIRDDVKDWMLENWEQWEEEKPEWFDDDWKAMVDNDMVPERSKQEYRKSRRRSSLGLAPRFSLRGNLVGPVGGGGGS
jgi:hypothetical protein